MHRALVQSAALWGAPAWPVNQSLLQAANSVQLQQVRMPGHARRPGQSFPEWQARTLRDARVTLHRQGYERWSTVALASIWGAMGPRCARTTQPSKPTTLMEGHGVVGAAQNYRRHPGQYNPFRDPERHITGTAGPDWRSQAQHRPRWKQLQQHFIERHDPLWSSGKQPQLMNLSPTPPTPGSLVAVGSSLRSFLILPPPPPAPPRQLVLMPSYMSEVLHVLLQQQRFLYLQVPP